MSVKILVNGQMKTVADVIAAGSITKISNTPHIYTGSIWIPCDGSAISRTSYADLFEAISTTFGPGDGVTTFNIPTQAQARTSPPADIANTTYDDNSVHSHKIPDGFITTSQIADAQINQAKIADDSVSQAKLKTSIAQYTNSSGGAQMFVLVGGDYSFQCLVWYNSAMSPTFQYGGAVGTSAEARIVLNKTGAPGWLYAQNRYVTSSGEVFWAFLLRDKQTHQMISGYMGPDHPCFGNGSDPEKVPHPFPDFDESQHEIIVLNPDETQVLALKKLAKSRDGSWLNAMLDLFDINEETDGPWPTKAVTVGLPDDWDDVWASGSAVTPVKNVIPQKDFLLCKSISLKK